MSDDTKAARLEAAIRDLTRPINGQYPRPWMTSSRDPASSKVFVVGKNQRRAFAVDDVGSHDQFIDALFNRGSETCRQLYDRLAQASPTRQNSDHLVRLLERHGVTDILETNVICYSTPEGVELKSISHIDGADRGRKIFKTLLDIIDPMILIVHGKRTVDQFMFSFRTQKLPYPPNALPSKPVEARVSERSVFVIPSLDPRVINRLGSSLVNKHHEAVCQIVAARLR